MDPASVEAIVGGLVAIATVVITSILAPLLLKQLKVADNKVSQQDRERLYPILINAISYGQAIITNDEAAKVESAEKIQNHIVDQAMAYARLHVGDTLDALGVNDDALRRMLIVRLQQAVSFAHANIPGISDGKAALVGSPSTPPTN